MTKFIPILDKKQLEAIKLAIGGASTEMRQTFDSVEKAMTAFNAARKLAPEGFTALYPAMRDEKGELVIGEDGNATLDVSAFEGPTFMEDVIDAEGNVTGQVEKPTILAAVAIVGMRVRNATTGKMDSGARALVMFPLPVLEAFMADDKGVGFVRKVTEKETAHVAFRDLRNAETVEDLQMAFDSMPRNVEGFVSSHTKAAEIDTTAFDAVWPNLMAYVKTRYAAIHAALPTKKEEVRRSIQSAGYASELYPDLESKRIFEWLGKNAIKLAESATSTNDDGVEVPAPIDASAIEGWIADRETFNPWSTRKALDESALAGIDLGMD